ncbi:nucleotidyltransferase family protein [Nocardioides sp.]|uniref:nucleotidyltransferase family protein n=1 Tax=Nocardioides sp. TaxID=35761 RepID=UPI00351E3CD5
MSGASLQVEEAVPLGHALILRVAADSGVRALAIKGPVLALQGLRPPKTSVDIDVLVDPVKMWILQAALERLGWIDDGAYDTPSIVPLHSVNHRHRLWPCEVDLHHWFPGFLASPENVFEVLWARRSTVRIAHVDIAVCDQAGNVAIAALHYLRDQYKSHELRDLAAVVRRDWNAEQVADLAALAADTGSAQTLRPLLDLIGAPLIPDRRPLLVPIADWEMRARTETNEVLPWIVELSRTPWPLRPTFLWRAFWLRKEYFAKPSPGRDLTNCELLRARWLRVRRGMRVMPLAWREYRRLRGRSGE